jgi:beta-lactamase superfamily II metal-dependent hydrolase
MPDIRYLDDDIVNLRLAGGKTRQFFWGDKCDVISENDPQGIRVAMHNYGGVAAEGWIAKTAKFRKTPLLRFSMIDVQQGDGLILETPGGKVIFIDGGDNVLFARHAAARFPGTSATKPLLVDAMIVTHGDADHFEGLVQIEKSETHDETRKRLFVAPKRYFHNGIVKRPSSRDEEALLGPTAAKSGRTYVVGLVDDPAAVPKANRNAPFKAWVDTLAHWDARTQAVTGQPTVRRRIDHLSGDAFAFLADEDIAVELHGPITEPVSGQPGLEFLKAPPDDAELMLGSVPATGSGGLSASHTINGHSIGFRLRYGNVRFLFTGDMNQASMQRLREALPGASLKSEILKAPHHGSADFDMEFLKEASPVVSMISSGDESAQKEYIHPRATLMSALGKASRKTPSIVFCTELAAFFAMRGYATDASGKRFFAFERTNFGIVHIRTDGQRVLAFTHSGKEGMNEAYSFRVSATGDVTFAKKVVKRSAPSAT